MEINKNLIRILIKLRALKYVRVSSSTTINHKRFSILIDDGIGLGNLFDTEHWMEQILRDLISPDDKTFIDVGVNVGQTLLKVRSVSDTINYVGFEPNINCVHYVKKLITINSFRNALVVPIGISNKSELGKLFFHINEDVDSFASILPNFRQSIKAEYIPLFDFETANATLGIESISILKIDVEGAELEVLKAFSVEIKKSRPIIFIEILPVYKEENTLRLERQTEIEKILTQLEYSLYRVNKYKGDFHSLTKLDHIGVHSNIDECDYMAVPMTKIERLNKLLEPRKSSN